MAPIERSHAAPMQAIRQYIAGRMAAGASGLGTYRQVSLATGFSVPTVARAVAKLRKAGVLHGGRGRAVRIAAELARAFCGADSPGPAAPRVAAWELVCGRIEDDVRAGEYSQTGRLPPVKVLAARYGACYRTVRRALADLCTRSVVRREGAGYGLRPALRPRWGGEVVLIARGNEGPDRHDVTMLYERTQLMLSRLDATCQQAGASLTAATVYYQGGDMVYSPELREILQSPGRRSTILGFVLWPLSLRRGTVLDLVEQHLRTFRVPIAVFDDEDRGLPHSLALSSSGLLQFFSLVNQRAAGRDTGRYLAQSGRRRALFVGRISDEWWVQERYAGVRESFAHGELRSVEFVSPVCARPVVRTPPPETAAGPGYYSLRGLSGLRTRIAARRLLADTLSPLLAGRLRKGQIDAVVGANDEVALVCMDVLAAHGVRPGPDMAVVGFDNTFESVACRLTSYDFNEPALIDAMVRHVLDRRWAGRFRDAGPVVSVPGRLVERDSSRRRTPASG